MGLLISTQYFSSTRTLSSIRSQPGIEKSVTNRSGVEVSPENLLSTALLAKKTTLWRLARHSLNTPYMLTLVCDRNKKRQFPACRPYNIYITSIVICNSWNQKSVSPLQVKYISSLYNRNYLSARGAISFQLWHNSSSGSITFIPSKLSCKSPCDRPNPLRGMGSALRG